MDTYLWPFIEKKKILVEKHYVRWKSWRYVCDEGIVVVSWMHVGPYIMVTGFQYDMMISKCQNTMHEYEVHMYLS